MSPQANNYNSYEIDDFYCWFRVVNYAYMQIVSKEEGQSQPFY
jgi:hypothetical protein